MTTRTGCNRLAGLYLLGICSTVMLIPPSGVQAAPVTQLEQAVRLAITGNPDVRAAWHRYEAADDNMQAAHSGFYPQIDLEGRAGHERQDPNNQPDFSYDPWHLQLSLTQMLFDGRETRSQVEHSSAERQQFYYRFRARAEDAALEATRAYLDVRRYQQLVELAKDNYLQHRSLYQDIEKRARAGVSRMVDVEQASARLALAETNLLTEATNLHDVSARFQRITGELPAQPLSEPGFNAAAIPSMPRPALQQAWQYSPVVNAAAAGTLAAQAQRAVRDAPMKPRLDLRLRHELEDDTDGVPLRKDTSALELVMRYNLYRGGADQARIREADHQITQAIEEQRAACRDVRQTLVIAHNDIASLTEQLGYLNRNQLAVGKARTQYRKQFDIGRRTLLDLLDTENEYFDVRRAWVNNQHDLMLAQARTLAAMGRLVASWQASYRGLETGTAAPVMSAISGRCPQDDVPLMPVFDKQALLAAVLDEPEFHEIGHNKLAFRMNAHFNYDSARLEPRYQTDIARAAQFLQRHPDVRASIEGHTDNRGSEGYNLQLSQRRAEAVYQHLIQQHGIDPQRLTVKGYGERRPLTTNSTDAGRQKNRRVELVIEKIPSAERQAINLS
ncbi:MAG: TolC family outer membrane protein [Marinobacterium sp.]|nr:TolC family outer membrane protein [Marinobacterium sp.]